MKIVGIKGTDSYLILTKGHDDPLKQLARVLSVSRETFYPEQKLHSILMRGYWEEYTGSQDKLKELLKLVKHRTNR